MKSHTRIFWIGIAIVLLVAVSMAVFQPHPVHADWAVSPGVPGGIDQGMKVYITRDVPDGNGGVNNVLGANTHIVGVFQIATTATANCDFYDAVSVKGAADSTDFAELAEATQWDSNYLFFPYPIKLQTGLSIGNEDSTCGVFYL